MATPTFDCTITTPMALNETNTAKSTLRWFLHKTEYDPRWCEFRYLVNGQRAFGSLYQDMLGAKHSIDIICWGFQPSMYFVRDGGKSMRIGELLAHKAEKDGVKVRLLCWHDPSTGSEFGENNMPGFDRKLSFSKRLIPGFAYKDISLLSEDYQTFKELVFDANWYQRAQLSDVTKTVHKDPKEEALAKVSRWTPSALYEDTTQRIGRELVGFKNFEMATRSFDIAERQEIMSRIRQHGKRAGWSDQLTDGMCQAMGVFPTHHQKTVLIDYEDTDRAVGYVMGHNMLDQYWDTDDHSYQRKAPNTGRSGPSPWHDISSRVTGPILQDINANFCQAWDEATGQKLTEARKKLAGTHALCLAGSMQERGVMAQVLRTQSQHGKTDIGKLYLQALNNATQYVFVQNQYFRWDDFAETIKQTAIKHQKAGRDPGKDGPIYLFVITNSSDAAVGSGTLTTYRMLESLGYGDHMPAVKYEETADQLAARKASLQASLTKEQEVEKRMRTQGVDPASALGVMNYLQDSEIRQREMWAQIGDIEKQQQLLAQQSPQPGAPKPGADLGIAASGSTPALKVMICTLVAPDSPKDAWVPVYVHAKLAIIDDAFTTLGSANINYRSMNVDSEINICLENGHVATELRQELWGLHTRTSGPTPSDVSPAASGHGGLHDELSDAYTRWWQIADKNTKFQGRKKAPLASLVDFYRASSDRSYKD